MIKSRMFPIPSGLRVMDTTLSRLAEQESILPVAACHIPSDNGPGAILVIGADVSEMNDQANQRDLIEEALEDVVSELKGDNSNDIGACEGLEEDSADIVSDNTMETVEETPRAEVTSA